MKKIIIHTLVNAAAFFVAFYLLRDHGINPQNMQWWGYILLAVIFGVINALIRPIFTLLGCPFIILTLGLGILLINTLIFFLTGLIGQQLNVGFTVDGFWPAFLGALIIGLIGMAANLVLGDMKSKPQSKRRKAY